MLHFRLFFLGAFDLVELRWALLGFLEVLDLLAAWFFALWVYCDFVGTEEIALSVVGEGVRKSAEVEKEFESSLAEEASNDTHRSRQTGRTDSFPLDRPLSPLSNSKRTRTAKTPSLPRHKHLNMPRKRTLRNPRLKPNLINIITNRIDGHPRTIIIDAAENEIDVAFAVD